MRNNKRLAAALFFIFFCFSAFASPLYSPAWGFSVDLPEDYGYVSGDGKDRFSFENPDGAKFDIIVYHAERGGNAPYASPGALARDVQRRLNSTGDMDSFEYGRKSCYILELSFPLAGAGGRAVPMSGWALSLELGNGGAEAREAAPLLLAMAYGPAARRELQTLHLSALDSLVPEEGVRHLPGPVTEYGYPRKTRVQVPVYGLGINALAYGEDAEAAQSVVDREFQILRRYVDAPNWKEAWTRFYRAIYRDSFDRLADIAFQVERKMNVPSHESPAWRADAAPGARDFADGVLLWVQGFKYERDLMGSDFVNLVSAAVEGRGDCDSRAMLWALVLNRANIPGAIMVSRHYGHAMGLADLPGGGARFEAGGKKLLVAETTAKVKTGLIEETVSDPTYWLGILFE